MEFKPMHISLQLQGSTPCSKSHHAFWQRIQYTNIFILFTTYSVLIHPTNKITLFFFSHKGNGQAMPRAPPTPDLDSKQIQPNRR